MREYWAGIFCEAVRTVWEWFRDKRRPLWVTPFLVVLGLMDVGIFLGWDAMASHFLAMLFFGVAPTVVIGVFAVVCNMAVLPAKKDATLRERLNPMDHDPALVQELLRLSQAGNKLLVRAANRHMGDNLERDFEEWCATVSAALHGRVDANEWLGFETIVGDLKLGPVVVSGKVNKLRFILMRYSAKAPAAQPSWPMQQVPPATTDDPSPQQPWRD